MRARPNGIGRGLTGNHGENGDPGQVSELPGRQPSGAGVFETGDGVSPDRQSSGPPALRSGHPSFEVRGFRFRVPLGRQPLVGSGDHL